MQYIEKHKNTMYTYKCEDLFGVIDIESTKKLDGELLDDIVEVVIKQGKGAGTVTGTVKITDDHIISYKLTRSPMWIDNEEEKRCNPTHTSTKKQERESIQTRLKRIKTFNWLLRFVVAFRKAWRKSKDNSV